MRKLSRDGFTLLELMIVVVIIGLLAAIAIPNYMGMQVHAREASTKRNCRVVQMTAEDFSVRNDGRYPATTADMLPTGHSLIDMLPEGIRLENPFTQANTEPIDGPAGTPGQTGYLVVQQLGVNVGYLIDGFGHDATILVLTSGQ